LYGIGVAMAGWAHARANERILQRPFAERFASMEYQARFEAALGPLARSEQGRLILEALKARPAGPFNFTLPKPARAALTESLTVPQLADLMDEMPQFASVADTGEKKDSRATVIPLTRLLNGELSPADAKVWAAYLIHRARSAGRAGGVSAVTLADANPNRNSEAVLRALENITGLEDVRSLLNDRVKVVAGSQMGALSADGRLSLSGVMDIAGLNPIAFSTLEIVGNETDIDQGPLPLSNILFIDPVQNLVERVERSLRAIQAARKSA
jgi:hypothetical protein